MKTKIAVLVSGGGKSTDYVMKDIEKMIKKGWFRQGHMDKQKTCLIVTNQMYHQYLALEEQREAQQMEEARKQGEEQIIEGAPAPGKNVASNTAEVKLDPQCLTMLRVCAEMPRLSICSFIAAPFMWQAPQWV